MAPFNFASADIDKIVDSLTTDEAILLTAGVGFWRTHAIERLGVPAVKVSGLRVCSRSTLVDPRDFRFRSAMVLMVIQAFNMLRESRRSHITSTGLRGNRFFMSTPAKCLPVRTPALHAYMTLIS